MSTLKVAAINNPSASSGGLAISASGLVTGAGLDLIVTQSFSAASSVSLNNCFSADYDNYRMVITMTSGTSGNITARLRASGTDNSASNYYWAQRYTEAASGTTGGNGANASTSWTIAFTGNSNTGAFLSGDFYSPAIATPTWANHAYAYRQTDVGQVAYFGSLSHSASTAFDGISIFGTSMTGTVSVYGYRK